MSSLVVRPTRQRRSTREEGFSLAEILVAMGILAVVLSLTTAVFLQTRDTTATHARGVLTQADLLDTTSTLTRSLTLAERFLIAEEDVVQIESVEEGVLTRTTYWVHDPGASDVDSRFSLDEGLRADLPDERALISYREASDEAAGLDVLRVLVHGYSAASTTPLFAYFDASNEAMPTSVESVDLGAIRRVSVSLSAEVEGRQRDGVPVPMTLETSVSPRLVRTSGVADDDLVPPAAPVLRGTLPPGLRTSTLTWSNIAGATSYTLLRETVSTGETTSVAVDGAQFASDEPRHEDAGLTWGETYRYSVVAAGPGGLSTPSNNVPLTVVPEQPQFLNVSTRDHGATATSARGLDNRLVWTARHGAEGYRVYRDGSLVHEGAATAWTDAGRTYGSTADYRVVAWNSGSYGSGGDSLQSDLVTLISPPVAPDLTASASNGDRTLAWSASSNTLRYSPERVSPSARTFADTMSRTYVDTEAVQSPRFTYRVRAGNDAGWSPYSSSRAVDTRPEPPRLTGSRGDEVSILSWSTMRDATSYVLQRDGRTIYEGAATSHRDSVAWGSTHTYRVLAANKTGASAWSNDVTLRQQPGPFDVQFDNWSQAQYGEERGARITPRWTASAASTDYTVYRTAHGSYPYGGDWAHGYSASWRNDGGASSATYPTGVYTYVIRATAANGESRDVRTTVQAPPELPREIRQETVYRTGSGASMYGRFDVVADPLDGSRDSTYVSSLGGDGAGRWYSQARFTHQNSTVGISVGSVNAVGVQNYRSNFSGAQVHFPTSRLQVFGVRQGQDGLDRMRENSSDAYVVMDPVGSPNRGYYAPWGHALSQWKGTGAFGSLPRWEG